MNAGRKFYGAGNMAGKVYVTAGLGGMSGAQGKAVVIAGCIGVIAEVRWDIKLSNSWHVIFRGKYICSRINSNYANFTFS